MPLANAKCSNCGAKIKVDDSMEAAVCPCCGAAFIVDKAVGNYNRKSRLKTCLQRVFEQLRNK